MKLDSRLERARVQVCMGVRSYAAMLVRSDHEECVLVYVGKLKYQICVVWLQGSSMMGPGMCADTCVPDQWIQELWANRS
jgi:hypothetical protein